MATLDDVAHLPCLQDALLVGRHPLLSARDVAALRVAGAVSRAVLQPYWARVARDLRAAVEGASPHCRKQFVPGDVRLLRCPDDVLSLSASDAAAMADRMGLPKRKSGAENAVALLEAHDARTGRLTASLPPAYVAAFRHLNSWRITKSTAMKEWKLRPAVLDTMPHDLAPSPYPGGHDMRLYRLRDVVAASAVAWRPDPSRQPTPDSKWVVGVVHIRRPCPPITARRTAAWTSVDEVYAAAEEARAKRQRREHEAEEQRRREVEEQIRRCEDERARKRMLEAHLKEVWGRDIDPHNPRCLVCRKRTKSRTVAGILSHMLKFHASCGVVADD